MWATCPLNDFSIDTVGPSLQRAMERGVGSIWCLLPLVAGLLSGCCVTSEIILIVYKAEYLLQTHIRVFQLITPLLAV